MGRKWGYTVYFYKLEVIQIYIDVLNVEKGQSSPKQFTMNILEYFLPTLLAKIESL